MAEMYGLPLKMSYNTVRGFHIQLCSTGKDGYTTDNLPDEFIKITKCKNVFSFTTADLVLASCSLCIVQLMFFSENYDGTHNAANVVQLFEHKF